MQTLKIHYTTRSEEDANLLLEYRRQYSKLLHWSLNRLLESDKGSNVVAKESRSLNGIELVDSAIATRCAANDAEAIIDSMNTRKKNNDILIKELEEYVEKNGLLKKSKHSRIERAKLRQLKNLKKMKYKVIFGGRKTFFDRMNGNITKEEYRFKRIGRYCSIGHKQNHGNDLFQLREDISGLTFKPKRGVKIDIDFKNLCGSYRKLLEKLYLHQQNSDMPYTVSFDSDYVYIAFSEKLLNSIRRKNKIKNRVLALDMNPDYIGWSIVDWKDSDGSYSIVKTGVYSIKKLNDLDSKIKVKKNDGEKSPYTQKRKTEIFNIVKNLVKKGIYYRCDTIGIEDLDFSKSVNAGSRKFNKKVNQHWCRQRFEQNLEKWANILDFAFQRVAAEYSSKFGNVLYRKHGLPDMVNASIEIGRRAFEFRRQYVLKTAEKRKTIIHPDLTQFGDVIHKSLEEFGMAENCKNLYELFGVIAEHKKPESLYRVPFDVKRTKWFENTSKRSLTEHCEYARL